MKALVEELCSDRCAGRAAGTPGGRAARELVIDALRGAGLDPQVQPVPACDGANVLAALPGSTHRWVLVAAHYDHLGTIGGKVFRGADDNAAAVAILVEVARALVRERPAGRGVLVAAFDAEEPPHFLTESMGSEHFARHPTVPLDRIDLMLCMDLVGHALGPEGLPEDVRNTTFALGAERSEGTGACVDRLSRAVPGVIVRRADAEVIPPLSDYIAFWERRVPFILLTNARSRTYHTPEDTPEKLDFAKMAATARWLETLVRETCARPEERIVFLPDVRDDASTLQAFLDLTAPLAPILAQVGAGRAMATELLAACAPDGRLPEEARPRLAMLVAALESGLA